MVGQNIQMKIFKRLWHLPITAKLNVMQLEKLKNVTIEKLLVGNLKENS